MFVRLSRSQLRGLRRTDRRVRMTVSNDNPLVCAETPDMDRPSRLLKACFHVLAMVVATVIGLVEAVLLLMFLPRLGVPRENVHGIAGGFALANILLARLCADRVFKWFGQSRSGRFRETQTKMLAKPEGFVADDEVVEVSLPRTVVWTLIGMCLTMFLVLLLILAFVKFDDMNDVRYVYAGVALSGTLALGLWWTSNTCKGRADIEGIYGAPVGPYFRNRMVHWSDIESCEIVSQFDTFGKLIRIMPVFKDTFGNTLLKLDLSGTRIEDQERLVKYIKAKLPRSKLEVEV